MPLGRFELVCERYIFGTSEERKIILSIFDEEEKETFLQGCGLYHLFTDEDFYNKNCSAMGNQLYAELHK